MKQMSGTAEKKVWITPRVVERSSVGKAQANKDRVGAEGIVIGVGGITITIGPAS